MRMRHFWMIVVSGTTIIPTVAQARKTEPGSFLDWPVASTGRLVRQFDRDHAVRDRYERHFGHSRQYLHHWFGSLRLKRLTQDGVWDIYNVHHDGMVRRKNLHMRKGTLVFVDPNGTPILKQSCGNPMVPGSDQPKLESLAPIISSPDVSADVKPSLAPDQPIIVAETPTIQPAPPDVLTSAAPPTPTPTTVEVPITTDVAPPAGSVPVGFGGSSIGTGLIGFLPILIGGIHGGGGGGGTTHHPPVPEPSGFYALALGGLVLAAKRRVRPPPRSF